MLDERQKDRAIGCLLGLFCGDALGAQVEFMTKADIASEYPQGVRKMEGGGPHMLSPGQITDDSEMAIAMLRSIHQEGRFIQKKVFDAYLDWIHSGPFDVGMTIGQALLSGSKNTNSQSNGALMRLAPLAIYGTGISEEELCTIARQDAEITHANKTVSDINMLMALVMAQAIKTGCTHQDLYEYLLERARTLRVEETILTLLETSSTEPPRICDGSTQGWVKIAFSLSVFHLVNTTSFEDAVVRTIMRGGDTDTNGAIVGALMGSLLGAENIPLQWRGTVLSCKPDDLSPTPRPERYWARQGYDLACCLWQ